MSIIRDKTLAPAGRKKIDWVKEHMPVLSHLEHTYAPGQPFKGLNLSICLHLEAKTACMAEVFARSGARVAITGSNPLSTQDDVAAALAESGPEVYAWYNATPEEYNSHLRHTLDAEPDLIIDDGGDLITMLHREYPALKDKVIGAAEETTTGLIRLRAMEREGILAFPVIAVNDAPCKHLFDNRLGTGQSVWDGIMRATNLLIAGKTVVICGFGWCGKGIAARARGLGARVIICEVDPVRALEAAMEGYELKPLMEAAPLGNIFVTATGCNAVIGKKHFTLMKNGAMMCNAGHFNVEIDTSSLEKMATSISDVKTNIKKYCMPNGNNLYLLAEGRLVNLAAGDGHPAEIMDLSFALQYLAMDYLCRNRGTLSRGVLPLPAELNRQVAILKLESLGLTPDTLDEEQQKYLCSWNPDPGQ
ncbi:MAG: adenosylhomocysteinase [Firmicutes bacterium]|jgi:adenosylhomocysteinase|nr:adenosylhomocysteinase [Bacillota bacterium]